MTATYGFSLPGRRIDGRRFLEVANDLLVFRKFDDVLRMCNVSEHSSMEIVFPQIRNINNSDSLNIDGNGTHEGDLLRNEEIANTDLAEKAGKRKFSESLCILAIQAYAETDQWDRVHPFLKQYYESQARYPVIIIKLCILLHAKVNNFSDAENLGIEWLSDNLNQTLPQYSSILELLLIHVFLPQTKIEEAKAIVELNPQLSPEKKMSFLKYLEKVQEELKMKIAEKHEGSTNDLPGSTLMRIVQRLGQLITRLIPITGLRYIRDIACLGFFIYLIVVRTNLDLSSSMSHAAVLWSGVIRIWRSLFAPFHLMPKA